MGESFTTNTTCGGISSGTNINSNDTVQKLIKDMVVAPEPPSPPNNQYDGNDTLIATWNTAQDVDNFFSQYSYQNGWAGLKLGNRIDITSGGSYTTSWVIAGFNMEHNQTAYDGTVYDNGYGICLIPKTESQQVRMYDLDAIWVISKLRVLTHTNAYRYGNWDLYSMALYGQLSSDLLHDHIAVRNILVRPASTYSTLPPISDYLWITRGASFMTLAQSGYTYDNSINEGNGEANYKLPLFNYTACTGAGCTDNKFMIRNFHTTYHYPLVITSNTSEPVRFSTNKETTTAFSIKPMIYLR